MSGDGVADKGRLNPGDAAFVDVVSDVLRRGHSVRFRANGASMRPNIREGEVITVAPVQPAQIRRGDVVLYRSSRGVIAHRVVRITRRPDGSVALLPRGDASRTCDEPVEEAAVLGRVVAVERDGRRVDPTRGLVRALAITRAAAVRLLRWLRVWPLGA